MNKYQYYSNRELFNNYMAFYCGNYISGCVCATEIERLMGLMEKEIDENRHPLLKKAIIEKCAEVDNINITIRDFIREGK